MLKMTDCGSMVCNTKGVMGTAEGSSEVDVVKCMHDVHL